MAQPLPLDTANLYSSGDDDDPDLVLARVKFENFELQGKLKLLEQTATELRSSLHAATEERYSLNSKWSMHERIRCHREVEKLAKGKFDWCDASNHLGRAQKEGALKAAVKAMTVKYERSEEKGQQLARQVIFEDCKNYVQIFLYQLRKIW